jgi:hypothetical protein
LLAPGCAPLKTMFLSMVCKVHGNGLKHQQL